MISEDRGGNPKVMSLVGKSHLAWKRFVQKGLVGEGISLKQFYLLLQLAENPFLQPAMVAELLFCDRPTASVIIRNMEKREWIRREKDPKNRKHIRLFITECGREKLAYVRQLPHLQARFEQDPLACFSPTERRQFEGLLEIFYQHIQSITQESETGSKPP